MREKRPAYGSFFVCVSQFSGAGPAVTPAASHQDRPPSGTGPSQTTSLDTKLIATDVYFTGRQDREDITYINDFKHGGMEEINGVEDIGDMKDMKDMKV